MKNTFPQVSISAMPKTQSEPAMAGVSEECGSAWENVAHELRQPLSVIESLAFYLELTSKDAGACVHLQQIQVMVRRANRILADATVR